MDCSPPGSSVQGILQARTLEWVAISFSRPTLFSFMVNSHHRDSSPSPAVFSSAHRNHSLALLSSHAQLSSSDSLRKTVISRVLGDVESTAREPRHMASVLTSLDVPGTYRASMFPSVKWGLGIELFLDLPHEDP